MKANLRQLLVLIIIIISYNTCLLHYDSTISKPQMYIIVAIIFLPIIKPRVQSFRSIERETGNLSNYPNPTTKIGNRCEGNIEIFSFLEFFLPFALDSIKV